MELTGDALGVSRKLASSVSTLSMYKSISILADRRDDPYNLEQLHSDEHLHAYINSLTQCAKYRFLTELKNARAHCFERFSIKPNYGS